MKNPLPRAAARTLLAALALVLVLWGAASAEPLSFKPLNLLNGWQPYDLLETADPSAAIDPNGIVHLRGALTQITGHDEIKAFRLPKKLRPNRDVFLAIGTINGQPGRLLIKSDGYAYVKGVDDQNDARGFTSLEGVTFSRD